MPTLTFLRCLASVLNGPPYASLLSFPKFAICSILSLLRAARISCRASATADSMTDSMGGLLAARLNTMGLFLMPSHLDVAYFFSEQDTGHRGKRLLAWGLDFFGVSLMMMTSYLGSSGAGGLCRVGKRFKLLNYSNKFVRIESYGNLNYIYNMFVGCTDTGLFSLFVRVRNLKPVIKSCSCPAHVVCIFLCQY